MAEMFPKPWRSIWCGDAYRVYDANDRHLFVISGDEFSTEDEDPETATALIWGEAAEQTVLMGGIEELFPPMSLVDCGRSVPNG